MLVCRSLVRSLAESWRKWVNVSLPKSSEIARRVVAEVEPSEGICMLERFGVMPWSQLQDVIIVDKFCRACWLPTKEYRPDMPSTRARRIPCIHRIPVPVENVGLVVEHSSLHSCHSSYSSLRSRPRQQIPAELCGASCLNSLP